MPYASIAYRHPVRLQPTGYSRAESRGPGPGFRLSRAIAEMMKRPQPYRECAVSRAVLGFAYRSGGLEAAEPVAAPIQQPEHRARAAQQGHGGWLRGIRWRRDDLTRRKRSMLGKCGHCERIEGGAQSGIADDEINGTGRGGGPIIHPSRVAGSSRNRERADGIGIDGIILDLVPGDRSSQVVTIGHVDVDSFGHCPADVSGR